MKASELMLEDYVLLNGKPVKVCSIDTTGEIIVSGGEVWIDGNAVEPIPITPEILEKNGFVLKEEEVGMYGVKIAPHYTRDDLPFEVFCDGEPFAIWFNNPVNIKYIHQLQHALRLCGIEKEITI